MTALDLRGHGDSDRPEPGPGVYEIDTLADDVLAVAAAADLRSACPTITIGQTVGSGHFNQLEVADKVNLMIERFLAINPL